MKKYKNRHPLALGLQDSIAQAQAKSKGRKREGVEALHSAKAFPRPKGHCLRDTLSFAALLFVLTLVGAIIWNFEHFEWTYREVGFFFVNVILGLIPLVWAYHVLYPKFDQQRVQRGKLKALGRVVAIDRAGKILQDEAQQRALVEVYHQDKRYLLVANQPGLSLCPNATVAITWHSISQLCWIHETS